MALALLALIVAGAVAAAAILGVPGIRIVTVEELERPAPAVSAPASDVDRVSAALGLGIAMSLDDVRARVEMPVVPPRDPALGPPDAYLPGSQRWPGAWCRWSGRRGPACRPPTRRARAVLISQFDGAVNPDGFVKLRDQDVAGRAGVGRRVTGLGGSMERRTCSCGAQGTGDESRPVVPTRLAGDTLLWERDGLTYRLEGSTGLERAIEIAESISGNESDADGVVPS